MYDIGTLEGGGERDHGHAVCGGLGAGGGGGGGEGSATVRGGGGELVGGAAAGGRLRCGEGAGGGGGEGEATVRKDVTCRRIQLLPKRAVAATPLTA